MSSDIHSLLADLRQHAATSPAEADRQLHHRSIAALERLLLPSPVGYRPGAPHGPAEDANLAAHDDIQAAIMCATSGLGPAWRLSAGSKTIACPRCKAPAGVACSHHRTERVWALAALRRRGRVTPEALADLRRDLAADPTNTGIIRVAIDAGLLRLERAEDGAPRWVDAA